MGSASAEEAAFPVLTIVIQILKCKNKCSKMGQHCFEMGQD